MTTRDYFLFTAMFIAVGCGPRGTKVVVYCALDREFAEPVLRAFEERTGTRVLAKYDTESTKSVGLAEQILREKERTRCDVFWNNEILHTIRLDQAGMLDEFQPPQASRFPERFRSPANRWFGFAGRARVLLVNTDRVKDEDIPRGYEDLANPRWKGTVGIAKPLFGTTATHVASLFAVLGPEQAQELLLKWKANDIQVLSGNKQVAVEVGAGTLAMGLTDTDDGLAEIRAGHAVRMVHLESGPDDRGVLVIPNTVSVIKGVPHLEQARALIDFLLSPEVEQMLSAGPSAQMPLGGKNPKIPEAIGLTQEMKWMPIDFEKAAAAWDEAVRFIRDEFTAP